MVQNTHSTPVTIIRKAHTLFDLSFFLALCSQLGAVNSPGIKALSSLSPRCLLTPAHHIYCPNLKRTGLPAGPSARLSLPSQSWKKPMQLDISSALKKKKQEQASKQTRHCHLIGASQSLLKGEGEDQDGKSRFSACIARCMSR